MAVSPTRGERAALLDWRGAQEKILNTLLKVTTKPLDRGGSFR